MTGLARLDSEDRGEVWLVRISGEIDLSNAVDLMDAIAKRISNVATSVVLDLSGTSYLDSAGIAMIFRLGERLNYSRQDLSLVVPEDSPIRAVVELTGVHRAIPVLPAPPPDQP